MADSSPNGAEEKRDGNGPGGIMTEEELKKVQKISLRMAEEFYAFCEFHHLTCYLCGGGCIGAVRNAGMIPWDDDLDFFMPRKDYETALRLWKEERNNGRYFLENASRDMVTHTLFFKIRDRETTCIYDEQQDVNTVHGVALDVLPLDGYPARRIDRMKQVFWACIYSLFRAQVIPSRHGRAYAIGSRFLLSLVRGREMRYRIWRYAETQMTKYSMDACDGVTELCSGLKYMKNYYPKDIFGKALRVPFENTFLPVPVGYDAYLRIAFGDYMKLPPENERVPHHDASYLDLETPCASRVMFQDGKVCLVRKESANGT